jgi:superfamily II DNA helicase RecQ
MQIKIFNIPIPGSEAMTEEMNVFLRTKRILQTESHIVNNGQGSFWSFCIKYLEHSTTSKGESSRRKKVDYKEVLDEISFQRFARMREIRKTLAKEEGIPAYAIFTDEELAGLAKMEDLTPAKMQTVKGVGEKKVAKYSSHFIIPS